MKLLFNPPVLCPALCFLVQCVCFCWPGKTHLSPQNQTPMQSLPFLLYLLLSHFLFFFFLFFLHRGCTDIICCILFLLVIIGYIVVGVLGKRNPTLSTQAFSYILMFFTSRSLLHFSKHKSCVHLFSLKLLCSWYKELGMVEEQAYLYPAGYNNM